MSTGHDFPRLLIVDDEPLNLKILVDLLRPYYQLAVAKDGVQALDRVQGQNLPDLILSDVMMPHLDGFELCRRLKANPRTQDIPLIFISALGEVQDELTGFDLGAADYITKPVSPSLLLSRVRTHLALRKARNELEQKNRSLEQAVIERTEELLLTQDITIRALASLAETRDNETGNHLKRTQNYIKCLAGEIRHHPRYADQLTDKAIDLMVKSAPLHDIGKVGIRDSILLKPGKLTPEEFEIMKDHPVLGRRALLSAIEEHSRPTDFLRYAIDIVSYHHEKWDGSGYPQGLKGEQIPVAARLMALADVYDALVSRRSYKKPFSHEDAAEIIKKGSGLHFDPALVAAFERCEDAFQSIAKTYADPH